MQIKEIAKKILKKLVHMKIYIARTIGWMGIANSIMLVFLVLDRLKSLEIIKTDLGNALFMVMVIWFFLLIFLGWFEVEILQAPHRESEKMISINPPMQHIYNTVDRIEKKLNELEKELKEVKDEKTCEIKDETCVDKHTNIQLREDVGQMY